jgi:hypothetical protein
MAISHLCLSCGFDLAWLRARRDPYYALPLIICPDCGEAAVRRRHPGVHGWRLTLPLGTSLVVLAVQLGVLLGSVAAITGVCVEGERWARGNLIATPNEKMLFATLAFGALPVLIGAWLTAGFGHVSRRWTWPAFASFVALVMSVDTIGVPLAQRLLDAIGLNVASNEVQWAEFAGRLVVLAGLMVVATAGIPLGQLARAGHHRFRQARWRARRRRSRSRRAGR